MTTTLAQQLRSLSLPQVTSQFASDKRRPSILFDEREAANLDKATLHEIGVTGLTALINVDSQFESFHALLFSNAAIDFDRRVQSNEVNDSLDVSIESFLFRVSPYVLLRPAQKALEWLLYRFQIHIFNVDALLTALLPFHETTVFVRVIQTLDLTSDGSKLNRWDWLAPLQKPGIPLARQTLFRRLISDLSFLALVCEIPVKALAAFHNDDDDGKSNKSAAPLRPFFSFYAAAVIGALESTDDLSNKEIGILLKFVVKGLKSKSDDYKFATYLIVSALASKKTLAKIVVVELIKCVSANLTDVTVEQGISCLAVITHTQEDLQSQPFSPEVLSSLWSRPDFLPTIVGLQKTLDVDFFVQTLALRLVKNAVESGDDSMLTALLESDVEVSSKIRSAMAAELFKCFRKMKPEKQLSRKAQAGKVFRVLERKFPDEVGFVTQELGLDDKVAVSIIAAAGESANKGSALDSILLTCVHPDPMQRLAGIQNLVRFVEDNHDSAAPSSSDKDADLSITARLIEDRKSRIREAIGDRLRQDEDVQLLSTIVQSDIVMRRYVTTADSLTLFATLLSLRHKMNDAIKSKFTGEEKRHKNTEEAGLWEFLLQTILGRITFQSTNVVGQTNEQIEDQANIFEELFPHYFFGGILSDDLVVYLRESTFTQGHPLMGKIGREKTVKSRKDNANYVDVIVEVLLTTDSVESEAAIAADIERNVRMLMPPNRDTSGRHTPKHNAAANLYVVSILTKALSDERLPGGENFGKTALAFEVLELLVDSHRRLEEALASRQELDLMTSREGFLVRDRRLNSLKGCSKFFSSLIDVTKEDVSLCMRKTPSSAKQSIPFKFSAFLFGFLMKKSGAGGDLAQEVYRPLLKQFLLSLGSNSEVITFFSHFWLPKGIDDDDVEEVNVDDALNPENRFHSLNAAATLFHNLTFSDLESLLRPPSPMIPLLLSALLVSPHLRVKSAVVNCFHSLLFALKTFQNVTTPFRGCLEAVVERSDAIVFDPKLQLPLLVASIGKGGDSLLVDSLLSYIVDNSVDLQLREETLDLIDNVPSESIRERVLPAVDGLIESCAASSKASSVLRKILQHLVSESVASQLTPDALTSLLKAIDSTDSLSLIKNNFFSKLPEEAKRSLFSHLFEKLCKVDELVGEMGEEMEIEEEANEEDAEEEEAKKGKSKKPLSSASKFAKMSRGVLEHLTVDASIIAAEMTQILPPADDLAATTTIKETKRRKTQINVEKSSEEVAKETAAFHRKIDKLTEYIRSSLRKIGNPELLVPSLQKVIEHCLAEDNESKQAASCAYSRDLCLATISTILARLSSKDKHALKLLIPAKFNVEVIVQCIRSPNATRQSNRNALNIVNVAAEVAPKAVLPNVMSIFTFVGQYLLRRDDGFSLQMLEATLDAVVPVLVADSGENATMDLSSAENDHDHGLEVARKLLCVNRNVAHALRVFVDAAPHIPAHRKMTIFKHLMGRLENQNALWSLVVIALEVQVLPTSSLPTSISDSIVDSIRLRHNEEVSKSESQKIQESFHFWISLCLEFGIEAVVVTLQRLVTFIATFPEHLVSSALRQQSASSFSSPSFLDVRRLSPRHVRQLLFFSASFANQLLAVCVADKKFLDDQKTLEKPIRSLVETLVNLLLIAGRRSEGSSGNNIPDNDALTAKFWKGILSKGAELLDKINSKLSERLFLSVTESLMQHASFNVKRKSLDLLATQLSQMVVKGGDGGTQNQATTKAKDPDLWLNLIPSLLWFLQFETGKREEKSGSDSSSQETTSLEVNAHPIPPQTMQAALLCLKLLARVFGRSHPKSFVPVVKRVTLLLAEDFESVVRSSIFLTLAELCCCLKAQTVPLLNRVVPLLLAVVLDPPSRPPKFAHDLLLVSSLTAICKLLETIPEFLSPHLVNILVGISSISVSEELFLHAEGPYKNQLTQRIPKIQDLLTSKTPSRSFLPAISTAFCSLNEKSKPLAIIPLMDLLKKHLQSLSKEDFNASANHFANFFVGTALDFRAKSANSLDEDSEIKVVENGIVDACIAMVMRMSEPTFRPFFFRLYDWAVEDESSSKDRILTFYVTCAKIGENLKALFGMFIGHTMKNIVEVLKRNCVLPKIDEPMDEDAEVETPSSAAAAKLPPVFKSESKNVLLLRFILDTMTTVFKYDKKGDVAKDNFDALHLPLVDLLENGILLKDYVEEEDKKVFEPFVDHHLAPCIGAMAGAANDFGIWKKLTYQICLKTKSASKRSRLKAIAVLEAVALRIGQEFLGLLPETAPFLAELMEDEEEEVERRVQEFIHILEEQLGENLQKYFT